MTEVEGLIAHNIIARQMGEYSSSDPVSEPAKLAEMYLASSGTSAKPWAAIDELQFRRKIYKSLCHNKCLVKSSFMPGEYDLFAASLEDHLPIEYEHYWPAYEALVLTAPHHSRIDPPYTYYCTGGYDPIFQVAESENAFEEGGRGIEAEAQGVVWVDLGKPVKIPTELQELDQLISARLTTESRAVELLKRLASSPAESNAIDVVDLLGMKSSNLLPALGWLLQRRAITIHGNKIYRNHRGTYLLRSDRLKARVRKLERASGDEHISMRTVVSMAAAAALTAIALLYADLKHHTRSKLNLGEGEGEGDCESNTIEAPQAEAARAKELSSDEGISNPNYQAFLKDLPELQKEYGSCVVAYYGGKMIAVKENVDDLLNEIPEEYRGRHLFIEYLPQKKITIRPRFHLLTSR